MSVTSQAHFKRVAIIGIGLIGSSIASALREYEIADEIVCGDSNPSHVQQALELGLVDAAYDDNQEAVEAADLVVLCTPVGAIGRVAGEIVSHLATGCILTDVGSVKKSVIEEILPLLSPAVHFIPGHPIAGTEESGPAAGFAELFQGRWCILTPLPDVNAEALLRLRSLWESLGAKVEIMTPDQHDRALATTSHLPQMVSYTTMNTARDMSDAFGMELVRYSAGGFRDVTRIAASDPVMWRDIFIHNREAALEVVEKFAENLGELKKAISDGDGDKLKELFSRASEARRKANSEK
ncbi:MAG: prephenate dehydrogenase/arogenate dehydrogenase family protein [Alphaproteobacteria bacterium]|nr:prephenate dehydrogenase/arogenate dehydrogenase family protein [Alphaproteobacteria bacterium]